jgi:hypothetical protein
MRIFHFSFLLLCILSLNACDTLQRNGARAGKNIDKSLDETRYKISRYIYEETPPPASTEYVPPPRPRFCYEAMTDIICYDRPQPHMHLNLVAAHGDTGHHYEDYLPASVRPDTMAIRTAAPLMRPPSPQVVQPMPTPAPIVQKPATQPRLSTLPPAVNVGAAPSIAGQ